MTGKGRGFGFHHSKETRQKMSKAQMGNTRGFKKGQVSWMKGKHHTEEAKKKLSIAEKKRFEKEDIWNKGKKCPQSSDENHWNWQGGITPIKKRLRRSVYFKNWRKVVFERDDYTCRMCGVRGVYLHPHHIENFADFPEERFDVNNGITFCRKCHYLFHSTFGFRDNNLSQINNFLFN